MYLFFGMPNEADIADKKTDVLFLLIQFSVRYNVNHDGNI